MNATTVAEIIGVKPTKFTPIEVSAEEAYKAASENPDFSKGSKRHISYSDLTKKTMILQRIIINCLRPKVSSKTDLSKFEVKLIRAIMNEVPFSLHHVIILHMHKTLQKNKGQLPYGTLIIRIFIYLKIDILDDLCKTFILLLLVGEKMIAKMKFKQIDVRLKRKEKELTRIKDKSKIEEKSKAKTVTVRISM